MATVHIPVTWNLKQYISGKGSTWHSISLDSVQATIGGYIPSNAVISNARLVVKAAFDGGFSGAKVYLSAGYSTSTSGITNKYISSVQISKTSSYYYSGYILSSLFSGYTTPFNLNRQGCSYITCEIQSGNIISRNHYVDEIAIEVTYDIPNYTITANASGGGSVSGGGTYANRTSVNLTATPNTGYRFVQWQDGNKDNPRNITVTGNATYIAYFEKLSYTISEAISPSEGGTITGDGTYEYGSTPTLTAIPNTGYKFVRWNDGNTSASRVITVTGDATYTAYFEKLKFNVTIEAPDPNTGTITGAVSGEYEYGTKLTLTANPKEDYMFDGWVLDGYGQSVDPMSNPITFTVLGEEYVEARIVKKACYLTFTVGNDGIGGIAEVQVGDDTYYDGIFRFDVGTDVTLTAIPDEGYKLSLFRIVGDDDTDECGINLETWQNYTDNPLKFTVTGETPTEIIAFFEKIINRRIEIGVNDSALGEITGAVSGEYPEGTKLTLTAKPKEGCKFIGWSDGVTVNPRNIVVDGSNTYTAIFEKMKCTVILDCYDEFSQEYYEWLDHVTITGLNVGENVLECGQEITLTIEGRDGYICDVLRVLVNDAYDMGTNLAPGDHKGNSLTFKIVSEGITIIQPMVRKEIGIVFVHKGVSFSGDAVEENCTVTGLELDYNELDVGQEVTLTAVPDKGYVYTGMVIKKSEFGFEDDWGDVAHCMSLPDGYTTEESSITFTVICDGVSTIQVFFEKLPEFTSVEMKYLDEQISETNKVICGEGFIISVEVT